MVIVGPDLGVTLVRRYVLGNAQRALVVFGVNADQQGQSVRADQG
jgi:hypothetical protein